MNDRVKELRKSLGLSGEEFGIKLGLKKAAISKIETGTTGVTEQTIKSICREYHVNEHWLRSGEGEMFIQVSRDEEIAAFIGGILSEEDDTFKKRFISMLAKLDVKEWEFLEKKAMDLVGDDKKRDC